MEPSVSSSSGKVKSRRARPARPGYYKKIHAKLLGDERVRRLSRPPPNGYSLWLHLLIAREHTPIPGVVRASAHTLAGDLQWSLRGVHKAFAEIGAEGMALADWEAGLVWLPNSIKHNPPANPNVVTNWGKVWPLLPESPLLPRMWAALRESVAEQGASFLEAFLAACPRPEEAVDALASEPLEGASENGSEEVAGTVAATVGATVPGTVVETPAEPFEVGSPNHRAESGEQRAQTPPEGVPPPAAPPPPPVALVAQVAAPPAPAPTPPALNMAPAAPAVFKPEAPALNTPPARPPRKPKPSRPESPPDARHAPLVAALCAVFLEVRGAAYAFTGRDAADVTGLLELGEPGEVVRRWRTALARTTYPTVSAVAELRTHWNHFAGTGPPRNFAKGSVRPEEVDWSPEAQRAQEGLF